MSSIKYYKIDPEGRTYEVVTKETEISIQRDVVAKFATDVGCKIANVMDAGVVGEGAVGRIGISAKAKMVTFTIPVGSMPMRAVFVMKDGILVPDFTNSSNDTYDLKWVPPMAMRLLLVVHCPLGGSLHAETQFLVAMDSAGRFWRLPTSNTYEDCRLCTGQYNSEGSTLIDVLARAWTQFQSSRWQRDLSDRGGRNGMANSMAMFRYKPNATEGFDQLPISGDWTGLCTKISSEFITNNVVV